MMKYAKHGLLLVYFVVCVLGFLYFGPTQYTSKILKSPLYQKHFSFLGRIFWPLKKKGETVAEVKKMVGELRFQPQDVFVYLPAGTSDSIPDKSFLVTSPDSQAWLKLYDETLLRLDADTTVYLEIPEDKEESSIAISLQVIQGEIKVQRQREDGKKIEVKTQEGKKFVLEEKKFKLEAKTINQVAAKIEQRQQVLGDTARGAGASARIEQREQSLDDAAGAGVMSQRLAPEQTVTANLENGGAFGAGSTKLSDQTMSSSLDSSGAPASLAVKVPDQIAPPRRVIASIQTEIKSRLPEKNHITKALSEAKGGNVDEATRLMAETLRDSAYSGVSEKNFPGGIKLALDSLFTEQVKRPNCPYVKDFIKNISTRYSSDSSAQEWASAWSARFRGAGCRL
jgi:predicted transcriptional regulator